jgi:hypothetical protein
MGSRSSEIPYLFRPLGNVSGPWQTYSSKGGRARGPVRGCSVCRALTPLAGAGNGEKERRGKARRGRHPRHLQNAMLVEGDEGHWCSSGSIDRRVVATELPLPS